MRKHWLLVLFSMMLFSGIVDDEGGGADADEIDDFEIDDENLDDDGGEGGEKNDGGEEKAEKPDNPPDETEELKKRLEALEREKEQADAEKAVVAATTALKEKYRDFDIEKIAEKLKAMPKEEQEMYNNPVGWEALHLKYFAKADVSDPFDPGRSTSDAPFDVEKAYERVQKGDKKAVLDLFAHAK